MCLLLANDFVVPFPDLCGDWLSDRSQNTERFHLLLDVLVTGSLEQTQSSWRNIELSDLVLLADIPVSAEIWVRWSTFEHNCSNAKNQR